MGGGWGWQLTMDTRAVPGLLGGFRPESKRGSGQLKTQGTQRAVVAWLQ